MDVVKNDVIKLVKKELDSANKTFPLFSSNHEGYAVIKEELEETEESLMYTQMAFCKLWEAVKENKGTLAINHAESVTYHAINIATEAIQLAAMGMKLVDSNQDEEK